MGPDCRREHSWCAQRHRRSTTRDAGAGERTYRPYRFGRRSRGGSDGRCLLRDEARGVGDLRGLRQESSGDMRVTVVFNGSTVDDPRAGVEWLAQVREQASS